jgi:hypothetical protein
MSKLITLFKNDIEKKIPKMNNRTINIHRLFLVLFIFALFVTNTKAQNIIICDFEGTDVADWKIAGKSFGSGPASRPFRSKKGITGFKGQKYVNSGYGNNSATGILISPEFTIERNYINFLIGGGNWQDELKVELLVYGKTERVTSGTHQEKMIWQTWNVEEFKGSRAIITVRDDSKREWGGLTTPMGLSITKESIIFSSSIIPTPE